MALTDALYADLQALIAQALEQMGAGWTGAEIVACLDANLTYLAWIEAQR